MRAHYSGGPTTLTHPSRPCCTNLCIIHIRPLMAKISGWPIMDIDGINEGTSANQRPVGRAQRDGRGSEKVRWSLAIPRTPSNMASDTGAGLHEPGIRARPSNPEQLGPSASLQHTFLIRNSHHERLERSFPTMERALQLGKVPGCIFGPLDPALLASAGSALDSCYYSFLLRYFHNLHAVYFLFFNTL